MGNIPNSEFCYELAIQNLESMARVLQDNLNDLKHQWKKGR